MPVSINNTQIVFNDATTQTTAGGPYTGARGQAFNAGGTFTIPTGVTAIKATVVGGGGGGGGFNPGCCGNPVNGNTGGTSSLASGTQTISTMTANGGDGGRPNVGGSVAGNASGGTLNASGYEQITFGGGRGYGGGGNSPYGYPGVGAGTAVQWFTGLTPGANLTVTRGAGGNPGPNAGAGAGGVIYIEW